METIFQSIEILSKEKGIDPQIVLDAVKDAMLIAARKHYRTNEDYVADMDPKTGAIASYAVKKVVEAVEDPAHEMTLARGRRIDQRCRDRRRSPHSQEHRRPGPHLRPDRQAGDFPESPRGRARNRFQRILGPHRRAGELHHQARRRARTTSSTSARPKPSCPRKSSRAWRVIASATACAASSRWWISRARDPACWCRAPRRSW